MAPTATAPEAFALDPSPKSAMPKSNGQVSEAPAPIDVLAKEASSHLDPFYKITEQPIGTRRPLRVACLGAGYSGLMMSIVFSQKMQGKNAELVVYERNSDLGGTWLENR